MTNEERHALVKTAVAKTLGTLASRLWQSKPMQYARLFTYGGGPIAERAVAGIKSPFAYQAAKNALMFGTLGGAMNVFLGDEGQSLLERYARGFVPGALGGIGWGLAGTGVRAAAAKLLDPRKKITGIKQRIGAWGRAGMERLKHEQAVSRAIAEGHRKGYSPQRLAKTIKKLESKRLPYQEYGKYKDIVKHTRGWGKERMLRLTPYVLGGGTAFGAALGGSALTEQLLNPFKESVVQSVQQNIPQGWPRLSAYGAYPSRFSYYAAPAPYSFY